MKSNQKTAKDMLLSSFNILKKQRASFLKKITVLPPQGRHKVEKALLLAEHAHMRQYRDDGAPYVIHPIRVALSLIRDFGYHSPTLLCAALLHDVVEDSSVTLAAVKRTFNPRVSQIVSDVTDMRPSIETEKQKRLRKRKKLQKIRKLSHMSRIVKCADLLDNVRSWPLLLQNSPSRKKIPRWLEEASVSYLPLAQETDFEMYRVLQSTLASFKKVKG